MLQAPAPWPLPGSFGLFEHEGLIRAARIVSRSADGTAVISLPERRDAGGNLRVPASDVLDGTPLTRDEYAELDQLGRDLHAILRGRKRARTAHQRQQLARHTELATRRSRATLLAEKLHQLGLRQQVAA